MLTIIEGVVDPFDHTKFDPVAVNTEDPQLSTTEIDGADGVTVGAATTVDKSLVQLLIVCVTEYDPGVVTVIDGVDSPVDQLNPVPEVVNTE